MTEQETTTATPTAPTMPVPPEMIGLPPYEPLNSNDVLSLGSRNGSGWWVDDCLRRSTALAGTPMGTPERAALLIEWDVRGEIDELGWEGQWADWSYVNWHIAAFNARRGPRAGEA